MTLLEIPHTSIVQFGASWCQPCKQLRPTVEALAQGVQVPFRYVDIEEHQELASHYGVRALPTVVLLKDGQERARINGNVPNQVRSAVLGAFKP